MNKNIHFFKLIIIALFSIIIQNCTNEGESKRFSQRMKFVSELTPYERAFYNAELEYLKIRDPKTEEIPENIRENELEFAKKLPSKEFHYSLKRKIGEEPTVQTQTWKPRGPWNIGGRCNSVEYDVQNENVINVASASGGLWRSVDGGNSWIKTTNPNEAQSFYCLEQDKRVENTNIWYAGTGELLSTTNRKYNIHPRTMLLGQGIYKSFDNGATWKKLPSTDINRPDSLNWSFQGIWKIVVDNTNLEQDIVYSACFGGIMRSTDGGASWAKVLGDDGNQCFASDIVMNSDGVLFAGISRISINGKKPTKVGIWTSINGIDWENITPTGFPDTTKTIKLALAPSNKNILYVLTEGPTTSLDPWSFLSSSSHQLFKLTYVPEQKNGNWVNLSQYLPNSSQKVQGYNTLGSYCMTIKVKPDNENVVFLGGTSLYRSTDGFSSNSNLKQIGGYYVNGGYDPENNYLHPDIHWIAFQPSNPSIMLVASDGGIHKTTNNMASDVQWKSLCNGLLATQFYCVDIDRFTKGDNFLIGGLQDNGTFNTIADDYRIRWDVVLGGDGMGCAVSNDKSFVLASYQSGAVASFLVNNDNELYEGKMQTIFGSSNFNFYTLFALDPVDNNYLFLPGKNKIFRKTNLISATIDTAEIRKGWSEISSVGLLQDESITAISVSTNPAHRLFYGTIKGRVFKMDNAHIGNPTAINITSKDFPKGAYVACIETDPKNADRIFVVFSNYNVLSIFYSADGGNSWEAISGNLEEKPDGSGVGPSVRWLKMLHTEQGTIYFVGTSIGLFSTTELKGMNTEWVKEGESVIGSLIVDVIQVRESDGLVVVGTQGGGVFSTNVNLTSVQEHSLGRGLILEQNYPNPSQNETSIRFYLDRLMPVNLIIYDILGNVVEKALNFEFLAGEQILKINTSKYTSGTYFYVLETPIGNLTKQMQVLK